VAVYDFLPDVLLEQVRNARIFWRPGVRQMDGKRRRPPGIFFRAPTDRARGQMMDHGYVFDGPHWDSPIPLQGLIPAQVYQQWVL